MSEQLGRLVRVEGIDGSGKSTQLGLARQFSEEHNLDALFVREPGGTPIGIELRTLLLHNRQHNLDAKTEFLLFTADRNELIHSLIMPALEQDRPVIEDRGIESSIAYQVASGRIDRATIEQVSEMLLPERYMRPDALALLSIGAIARKKRLDARFATEAADKMEDRELDYYQRVNASYDSFQLLPYAHTVNGERSPEEVFEDMKPILFGKYLPRDRHATIIS